MKIGTVELSKIFGVTSRTVAMWGERGCPKHGNNSWDIGDVIIWWAENIYSSSKSSESMATHDAKERYWVSKAREATVKADMMEELVAPVSDFEKGMVWRISELASGLTMLSLRISHSIAAVTGGQEVEIRKIIDEEVWKFRDRFAREGKLY
jgi:hypothetical protein